MLSDKSLKQLTDHLYLKIAEEVCDDDDFLIATQKAILKQLDDQVGAMHNDEKYTIMVNILERIIHKTTSI